MVVIDIPADLNMEDDEGRNLARLPKGRRYSAGDVAVAGRVGGWSWVIVDEVVDAVVYFHQMSGADARLGN